MAEFSGHLSLRAKALADGRTVLAAQAFRAPFHLSKPYWDTEAGVLLVQVVNPTAGLLAGDRLESAIAVESGAALLVTTPSASRIFTMEAGSAESRQRFQVATGGWLEVAPEPLVPHRGSRYRQQTLVEIEPGGGLFFVDQLQPGRVGHDEAWQWDQLKLDLTVRLDGELILRERFDQTGEALKGLADWAGSGPAACFANAVLITEQIGPDAISALNRLHGSGLWCGISALPRGGWSLRLVAADSVILRQALREIRRILATSCLRMAADLRKL